LRKTVEDSLLFALIGIALACVAAVVLQAYLLRGACSIYNGISGGATATLGVPDLGTFKALLIVLVALIFPFPVNLLVMAGMATFLLPTSFGRALVVSLIQTALFVLVCLLLLGFVVLLFSVNAPWMAGGRQYTVIEIAVFVAVALLLEVPVFYASTALTGYEPGLVKTFVVPVVTAGIWGAGAAVAAFLIGVDWLIAPDHRWHLVGFISTVLFTSLVVQFVLFYLLVPTSLFGGLLASVFQLLLRILLYVLLLAANMVFLGALQILRGPATPTRPTAALLAPVLDALACLL
jgi:hypothetical protein